MPTSRLGWTLSSRQFFVRRSTRSRTFILALVFLIVFLGRAIQNPPPDWLSVYEWENNLPQHNLDLPFPEGKNGRYLYFSNQLKYLGWNNILNEVLMNSYLSYKANRSYVFQDYVWRPNFYHWRFHPRRKWHLKTPLNALIAGPTAGGPWGPSDPAPRAISERFFDTVCPPHERRIINTRDVKPAIHRASGRVVFDTWLKLLSEAPERCIEIQAAPKKVDSVPQVFDLWFWGDGKSNELWEEFRDSPVSRLLATSPVVKAALDRNEFVLSPKSSRRTPGAQKNPFERMLTVHIRRGDYKRACMHFARYNSTFYSWNLLPFLPDKFKHPPGWGVDRKETVEEYMKHCFSTEEFLVQKLRTAREDYINAGKTNSTGEVRHLDTVYVLTNGRTTWLEKLKTMLLEDGWSHVVTTRDLVLTQEEKDVDMAVDMDIARKAAVFIGNGWSSMTANIIHRRLVDAKEPISTRFL